MVKENFIGNYLLSIVLISFGIGQANVTSVDIDTVQTAYGLFSPTTTPIAYNSQSGFGVVIRADYDLFTFRSEDGLNWEQDDFIDEVYPRYPSNTLSTDFDKIILRDL